VKNVHRPQCRGVLHCLCCTKHKHYTPLHSYVSSTVSSEAGDHSSAASRLRGCGSVCYCTVLWCVLSATFCIRQLCYSNSMKNDLSHWLILVPFLCAFVKLSCLPVSPSLSMEQLGSNGTDFNEIWYLSTFRKSVDIFQVSLRSVKNNGWFTWRPMHIYGNILLSSS
jgi:hypothetical protein